uniref:Uncharacterized protein n=1 Tax=Physcomitrium patens TaxID=3218 RepID=A0A2K1KA42_PHYPA|nr:hypothetical protein PHYPA_009823 [Physcomitrium patens]
MAPKLLNMSVAILPMSADFQWSPTTAGLVQYFFFPGLSSCSGIIHSRFSFAASSFIQKRK